MNRTLLPLLLLAAPLPAQTLDATAELLPPDPRPFDFFGFSLAVSGSRMAVGAVGDDDLADRSGTVYLLEVPSGALVLQLTPQDLVQDDRFGWSVALDGDLVLAGAPWSAPAAPYSGSAYLFDAAGGQQVAKLLAPDGAQYDAFGHSVALTPDRVLVGARGGSATTPAGAVYVFDRASLELLHKLEPDDGEFSDEFGATLAVDGDLLAVGARDDDGHGSVYLYQLSSLVEIAKLSPPELVEGDLFGNSLAVEGDRVVVGAPGVDERKLDGGAIYVFATDGSLLERRFPHDPAVFDGYGWTVALTPDLLLVGSPGDEDAPPYHVPGPGSVHVYDRQDGAFLTRLRATVPEPDEDYAYSLAADGAVIAVGAQDSLVDGAPSGSVHLFEVPDGSIASYCTGTACPCANDDAAAGCANSTGSGALLAASGTPRSFADDLVLEVSGGPAGQFGLVFMGSAQVSLPFGDGLRCVGAGTTGTCRFPVRALGAAGAFQEGPGIVQASQAFALSCRIDPGETWTFQGWYRDVAGTCGGGFNLTNGLVVRFSLL